MRITDLDHIVLVSPDPLELLAWYVDHLGLAPERVEEYRAGEVLFPSGRVSAGTLVDFLAGERTGENMNHVCFAAENVDFEALAADPGIEVLGEPTSLWGARGQAMSMYLRDPVGNVVEIRTYD